MSKIIGRSVKLYSGLLNDIRTRVRHAQNRAMQAVNTELLRLYWDIGKLILTRQKMQGWGAGVIPRLARDLRNELPEIKGFSERNIYLMLQFALEYPDLFPILQPVVAELGSGTAPAPGSQASLTKSRSETPSVSILQPLVAELSGPIPGTQTYYERTAPPLVAKMPWVHNILLMQMVKDLPTRIWYMRQTLANGWSRNVLSLMINNQAHLRQGKAISNFRERLPPAQSDLAVQLLKDPYVFDFLTLQEPFHERELETGLLQHLQKFLLELGQGFALVGRQFHIRVGDNDYYIDLLFYHLVLRCFVVIDLKTRDFEAEHAGKMNFYLNVLDEKMRHPSDGSSIGLILCRKRDRVVAEYALRGMDKPISISEYELTRALPAEFKSALPTIEQIEAELTARPADPKSAGKKVRTAAARPARRARPTSGKRKKR